MPSNLPNAARFFQLTSIMVFLLPASLSFCQDATMINIWPGKPPGEVKELPPEADTTTPKSGKVDGRRVIRLGNVSTPQIAVYQPDPKIATDAAVVICPGGGHHILAWDLEGTEVAEWLNSIGVTAFVLKYRVPAREKEKRYRAAVQDAQRTMSLVRHQAKKWKINPQKIGICGFSAGGETAGLTTFFGDDRTYKKIDDADQASCQPDFAMLIYPAYFVDKETAALKPYIKVSKSTPPVFLVHAYNDPVTPLSSILLAAEIKKAGGAAELHVFAEGGHGYGLRRTSSPVTHWPDLAEKWLTTQKILPATK